MLGCGRGQFLIRSEFRPRPGVHVVQNRLLPVELGMRGKKRRCFEIFAAGMTCAANKAHLRGQIRVHHLARHCAAGIEGRITPHLLAYRRSFLMAAQAALSRVDFVLIGVVVV